jgi:hypothetical protein
MISFQSFLRITKSVKEELQQSQNSVYLNLFLSLISLFFSYLVIYSDFLFEIKMGFCGIISALWIFRELG